MSSLSPRLSSAIRIILLSILFFLPYSVLVIQGVIHLFEVQGHPLPTTLIRLLHGWREVLLVAGFACVIVRGIVNRKLPFSATPLDMLLVGFMAIAVVVSLLVTDGVHSLLSGFRYGLTPFLYYFLARCITLRRSEIVAILRNLVLASLPIVVFSILQILVLPTNLLVHLGYAAGFDVGIPSHYVGSDIVSSRAFASFAHPVELGLYLSQIVLLMLFYGGRWFKKWQAWTVAAFSVLGLMLTLSNQPIVGLVASLLILGMVMGVNRYLPTVKAKSGIVLSFLVIVAVSGLTVAAVRVDRSATLTLSPIQRVFESDVTGGLEGRRAVGFDQISEYPYGRGLGSTGQALTNRSTLKYEQPTEPFSWYIQIGQELGWLGLVLVAVIIVAIIQSFHQFSQALHDKKDRYLLAYLVSGFVAILVSLVFVSAWLSAATVMWWIVFGLFLSDYLESFPGDSALFPIQKRADSGKTTAAL